MSIGPHGLLASALAGTEEVPSYEQLPGVDTYVCAKRNIDMPKESEQYHVGTPPWVGKISGVQAFCFVTTQGHTSTIPCHESTYTCKNESVHCDVALPSETSMSILEVHIRPLPNRSAATHEPKDFLHYKKVHNEVRRWSLEEVHIATAKP